MDGVPRGPVSEPRPELVEAVLVEQGRWLMARCESAAEQWPGVLDAHDLFQGAVQRMLRSRSDPDAHAMGVRTFLSRCVAWVALDLAAPRGAE